MNIDKLTVGINIKRCDECEYKLEQHLRDNLLVTAGARAAYMDRNDTIDIPDGLKGEADLAIFIARAVDYYLANECGNFDLYIEERLIRGYGVNGN